MSETTALSDRIDALEVRLTFQDETIEMLNLTITAQWQQIELIDAPGRGAEGKFAGSRKHRDRPGERTAAALLKTDGHACIVNQIAMTIIAITIATQTMGATLLVLPLRGESLAAWLNSVFITGLPSNG